MKNQNDIDSKPLKYSFLYANNERISPVNCGRMQCPSNHYYGPAKRTYYIIHFVFSGKGTFFCNGISHHLSPDWCFIIHPDEVTTYKADQKDPWNYGWLGFVCSPEPDFLKTSKVYIPNARPIFEKIKKEHIVYGKQWYILSLIGSLFAELSESNVSKEPLHSNQILKVKTKIENSFSKILYVSELANECCMDRSYFCKIFRKIVGMSPKEYHTKIRMENAANYLNNPVLSVGQIALDTGYPDVLSFSKAFKKYFGCSPTEYRKTH